MFLLMQPVQSIGMFYLNELGKKSKTFKNNYVTCIKVEIIRFREFFRVKTIGWGGGAQWGKLWLKSFMGLYD